MFHQNNLDFSKYTIMEYAFMGLDEDGNVVEISYILPSKCPPLASLVGFLGLLAQQIAAPSSGFQRTHVVRTAGARKNPPDSTSQRDTTTLV